MKSDKQITFAYLFERKYIRALNIIPMLTKYRFLILFFAVFIGVPLVYGAARGQHQQRTPDSEQVARDCALINTEISILKKECKKWRGREESVRIHSKTCEIESDTLCRKSSCLLQFYTLQTTLCLSSKLPDLNMKFYRSLQQLTCNFGSIPRWPCDSFKGRALPVNQDLSRSLYKIRRGTRNLTVKLGNTKYNLYEQLFYLKHLKISLIQEIKTLRKMARKGADATEISIIKIRGLVSSEMKKVAQYQVMLHRSGVVDIKSPEHSKCFNQFQRGECLQEAKEKLKNLQQELKSLHSPSDEYKIKSLKKKIKHAEKTIKKLTQSESVLDKNDTNCLLSLPFPLQIMGPDMIGKFCPSGSMPAQQPTLCVSQGSGYGDFFHGAPPLPVRKQACSSPITCAAAMAAGAYVTGWAG